MQRHARSRHERHSQRPGGLDAIEIDDFAAVEHGEVHRLADVLSQTLQDGMAWRAHGFAQQSVKREAGEARPCGHPAAFRFALQQAGIFEYVQHAIDRRLR